MKARAGKTPSKIAVIAVADLAEAVAALEAARRSGQPIALISPPPDSDHRFGAGWMAALLPAALAQCPGATAIGIYDAGDRADEAQAAWRLGVAGVVFGGDTRVAAKLAQIAAQGAHALYRRRPKSLDRAAFSAVLRARPRRRLD